MKGTKILKGILHILIVGGLLIQTLGCGTILYPERRGQKTGQIDIGVAVLDGLGLFLVLIPGVIAFAVDFSTGAIYLPPDKPKTKPSPGRKSSLQSDRVKVVWVSPDKLDNEVISNVIARETGVRVAFDLKKAEVIALDKTEDVAAWLVNLRDAGYWREPRLAAVMPEVLIGHPASLSFVA